MHTRRSFYVLSILALVTIPAFAQVSPRFHTAGPIPTNRRHESNAQFECRAVGPRQVTDVGFEGIKTTGWNFGMLGGGGEGKRFDPRPALETRVKLDYGCINAHLSVLVGSAQTYGGAPLALFQVTVSPINPDGTIGPPTALYGHYPTPFGLFGPAVALEAETDVDEFAANFFDRVGDEPGDIRPGAYVVDVWWAGAPPGAPAGNIAAAWVLKLYHN